MGGELHHQRNAHSHIRFPHPLLCAPHIIFPCIYAPRTRSECMDAWICIYADASILHLLPASTHLIRFPNPVPTHIRSHTQFTQLITKPGPCINSSLKSRLFSPPDSRKSDHHIPSRNPLITHAHHIRSPHERSRHPHDIRSLHPLTAHAHHIRLPHMLITHTCSKICVHHTRSLHIPHTLAYHIHSPALHTRSKTRNHIQFSHLVIIPTPSPAHHIRSSPRVYRIHSPYPLTTPVHHTCSLFAFHTHCTSLALFQAIIGVPMMNRHREMVCNVAASDIRHLVDSPDPSLKSSLAQPSRPSPPTGSQHLRTCSSDTNSPFALGLGCDKLQ